MICVLKEYEIKTKMVQEQWLQLKMFLLGRIYFWWKGIKIWLGGGEWANFLLLGDSSIRPVGKTLCKLCQQVFIYNEVAPCTSHTSCAKVAIILLQDLSTLGVTDIYGKYFHLSVQCLYYNKLITSWTHLIRPTDGRSISQKSISH